MINAKRFMLAVISASLLAVGLASCGDSSSQADDPAVKTSSNAVEESSSKKEIQGDTKTWGIYSVMVPQGWELRGGYALDDNDVNYCSVKKSDFTYFDFKSESDDLMKQQYDYNKKTYTMEQKDVSGKYGDIEWTGFEYGGELNKGFELYGKAGSKNVRVSCAGFTFDSEETKAVLSSLKIS